jgi:ssDNA-binding Zn-finger/Zn-ribbon topoisomerase 1
MSLDFARIRETKATLARAMTSGKDGYVFRRCPNCSEIHQATALKASGNYRICPICDFRALLDVFTVIVNTRVQGKQRTRAIANAVASSGSSYRFRQCPHCGHITGASNMKVVRDTFFGAIRQCPRCRHTEITRRFVIVAEIA